MKLRISTTWRPAIGLLRKENLHPHIFLGLFCQEIFAPPFGDNVQITRTLPRSPDNAEALQDRGSGVKFPLDIGSLLSYTATALESFEFRKLPLFDFPADTRTSMLRCSVSPYSANFTQTVPLYTDKSCANRAYQQTRFSERNMR